jgi:hypothetical protein
MADPSPTSEFENRRAELVGDIGDVRIPPSPGFQFSGGPIQVVRRMDSIKPCLAMACLLVIDRESATCSWTD